jgi:hypothetical protein
VPALVSRSIELVPTYDVPSDAVVLRVDRGHGSGACLVSLAAYRGAVQVGHPRAVVVDTAGVGPVGSPCSR